MRLALAALALLCACTDNGITAFDAPPEALIVSHEDGDTVLEGDAVSLRGVVSDPDHAAGDLMATWYGGSRELCAAVTPDADGGTGCDAVLALGEGEISLEVRDPQGKSAADLVSLTIQPTDAPIAVILAPAEGGTYYSDQLIAFDGLISDTEDDPDELVAWWASTLQDDLTVDATPDSAGAVSGSGYLEEGEHQITLYAEDLSGKVGTDSVLIEVGPPNSAPSCAITAPDDGASGEQGALVTFRGQVGDVDVPADWLDVRWSSDHDGDLGDSTPDTGGQVAFSTSDLSVATHTLLMTVTDEVGATCTDFILYTVGTPPVLTVTSPATGDLYEEGQTITFSATVSDNEDRPTAIELAWTSDLDGVLSTSGADSTGLAEFTRRDLSPGEHTLTVTATDTAGLFARALKTFTVNGLPSAPVVEISPDPASTGDALTVSLLTPAVDPEGDAIAYGYAWYRNGVLSSASTSGVLPASATAKGETWRVVVTPNDGLADGAPGEDSVVIANSAPVLASVALTPDPASVSSTLSCTPATATDADGDTVSYAYAWEVSGSTIAATGSTLGAPSFARGDTVTCTVTPSDGTDAGTAVRSNTVTIANSPPSIVNVTIDPNPAYAGDALRCAWGGYSDADGDADASTIAWTLNGSAAGSGTSLGAGVVRGDVVVCTVTPFDGTDTGTALSATLTVSNTPPVLDAVTLAPDPAHEGDTLTCTPGSTTDADGTTTFTYGYAWTVAGARISATGTTLSSASFAKGDTVYCTVTPSDGSGTGDPVDSNEITVENSAPSIAGVAISPDPATTGDTLTCAWSGFSDPDGDADASTATWTLNGGAAGGGTTLSATIARGDVVVCTVTPSDGSDAGTPVTDTLTVGNAAPSVTAVSLSPTTAYTSTLLTAVVSSTDPDGDAVSVSYAWTVDGASVAATGATLDGATYFDKHQDVVVTVTPSDGIDTGAPVASAAVTILNTPPTAPTVSIDPSDPEEGTDDLLCQVDVASTDADGDTITYVMDWDVDGTFYSGTATTTWPGDTVPATATTAGEVWTCSATPDDGDDYGDIGEASVTIGAAASGCGAGLFSGAYGSSWTHLATAPYSLFSLMDYLPLAEPYLWNSYGAHLSHYDPATGSWASVASSTPYSSPWNSMAWWDDQLWMIRNGSVYRYDIATDTWTTMASYTGGDDMNQTVADCEGRIYGHAYSGSVVVYDIATDTVTQYSTGHSTQCETRMAFDPAERAVFFGAFNYANLYRFDIDTHAITTMASHPESYLNDIFCGDHSGHLYAAGGSSGTSLWQYDIASNAWSAITSFPVSHGNNGSCTVSEDGWLYMADSSPTTLYRLPLY
ncbi:MAG: Ig-like domain-containing protein [Pseudomonadota bacterium]